MISAQEALEQLREGQPSIRVRHAAARPDERGAPARAGRGPGAVRDRARLLRLARAGGDRVRPGARRPVRDPRRRQHRRAVAGRQRRVRGGASSAPGLVVVLGHSSCGAILATLEQLGRPSKDQSRNLRTIVDRIRPSVEPLLATELALNPEALVRQAVRANILASTNHLRHGSEILEQLIQNDGLLIVGAEYSLETGIVHFFDGVPSARRERDRPRALHRARSVVVEVTPRLSARPSDRP